MMERASTSSMRRKKKTLNACQNCRASKRKCSGQFPCQHCISRSRQCVFDEIRKKLLVTEQYIQALQARASEAGITVQLPSTPQPVTYISSQRWPKRTCEGNLAQVDSQSNTVTQSMSISHTNIAGPSSPGAIGDEYRRLGHSSSWSFSRRVRSFIGSRLGDHNIHDTVPIPDGAYGIPWRAPNLNLLSIDLPTEEYAEYLTNTLCFAMDPLYYLFDKDKFLAKLHQFFSDIASDSLRCASLWHIQMLIVFAFGTSILAREASPQGPTGSSYFAKAIEALPDNHRLRQEPILAVEILCMVALFMQAMDMRRAAYDYIGQAVHIGLTDGLNRRYDAQRITWAEFEHRSKLWWTIYIIERKLSSLVGVPSALHDEDIALPMPPIDPARRKDITVAFHVELSSQLGHILTVVYGLGLQRQLGPKFIAAVQSILRRLADTSAMLNSNMKIELQRPASSISRAAASLHLLQHQCTILTVRPILFFLLETKLAMGPIPLVLSDAVIGLLRVCVESALQVLKIIEGLRLHNLIDLFLPFDLDFLFAGAFVLILVDIITPATADSAEQCDLSKVFLLMDEMNSRGIAVVIPYKRDLLELDGLRDRMKNQQNQVTVVGNASESNTAEASAIHVVNGPRELETEVSYHHIGQDLIWSWMATDASELGVLHPSTIQSAIDGLNFNFSDDPAALDAGGSEWMWGSAIPGDSNTPNHNLL